MMKGEDDMGDNIRALAKEAHHGAVDVIIGKNGLSEGVLREIDVRLKTKGYVKVKILKRCLEITGLGRKELAHEVSRRLGAELASVRGRTFVLYRKQSVRGESFIEKDQLRAKRSYSKPLD